MATASDRNKNKVMVGYANIFLAPYSATDPIELPANTIEYNGAWPVGWVNVGHTMEGLTIGFDRDMDDIMVEESKTPALVVVNAVNVTASFEAAEDTLQTMQYAYGGSLEVTAPGTGIPGMQTLTLSDEITEFSLGFEAKNSEGFYRRMLFPRVMQQASVEVAYRKNEARSYAFEFRVLSDLEDIVILNKTAAASA